MGQMSKKPKKIRSPKVEICWNTWLTYGCKVRDGDFQKDIWASILYRYLFSSIFPITTLGAVVPRVAHEDSLLTTCSCSGCSCTLTVETMLHQNRIHRSTCQAEFVRSLVTIDNTSRSDHSQEAVTHVWFELCMDEVRGFPLRSEQCHMINLDCEARVQLGKEIWKFLGCLAPIQMTLLPTHSVWAQFFLCRAVNYTQGHVDGIFLWCDLC